MPLPRSVRAAGIAGALAAAALALPSAASAAYTSSIDGGNPTLTGDANGDQLVISVQGANLAHNRATDPGFNSAIDFDSTAGGDQTVANTASVTVNAGDGDDFVQTGPNADTLNGEGGNDRILGGPGNDALSGGDGNDLLRGGKGDDTVDGGAGNDVIWVGGGADTANGGDGDDRLHALARDHKVDHIDCGPGNDTVWLNAAENDVHVNCETVKIVTVTGTGGDD